MITTKYAGSGSSLVVSVLVVCPAGVSMVSLLCLGGRWRLLSSGSLAHVLVVFLSCLGGVPGWCLRGIVNMFF